MEAISTIQSARQTKKIFEKNYVEVRKMMDDFCVKMLLFIQ
jgi:hypothetical protein